ncbi:hypothetical protein MYX77_03600 [Acidobacteriia bacterium AH_259_A11_L15]|nr:hypothetical protein [Acidobacteriia bacterium AH_259_A11_L15]
MREMLALALLCLLLALGSLGIVVWFVVDAALEGMIQSRVLTLDGLLMIAIGLAVSFAFGICFAWTVHDAHLWELVLPRRQAAAQPGNPSSQEKTPPAHS